MKPSRARIPLPTRILYGSGSVAFGVKDHGFAYFLLIYYNQVLGLPATAVGAALMVALLFDAFSDPIVGYVSDNWHSRLGRRHPFMYAAAIPLGIAYYFLWSPPELGETALLVYLTVGAIGVRSILTLYEVPSASLVPELTEDYDERTALISFRFFFAWYGGLTMAVLIYTVFLASTPEYPEGILNPDGYQAYGAVGALAITVSILVSATGTHRYIPKLKRPAEKRPFELGRLLRELRETLSNASFLALFFAGLFFAMGIGLSAALNIYLNTYFWGLRSEEIATIIYFQFASALIAPVLAPLLTGRFDKKRVAIGLGSFVILFSPSFIILRLLGLFPGNDSAWLLPLLRAHSLIEVTVLIMVSIALSSMIADVAEENEIRTGRREEGLFYAARNFSLKATTGIGTLLAGVALDAIRFPDGADPASLDPGVVFRLGLVYGPILMLVYLAGLGFILRYGISRQGHRENLAVLAARR